MQIKRLSDLGRIVTGKTPPTVHKEFYGGDIPFVTPSDMDGRRIIDKTERYLTDKGMHIVKSSSIPRGSLMISCIGSEMGKVAIAGYDCITNQQINSIIIDSEDDPLFLYYRLSIMQEDIRFIASGSAVPILKKSAFGDIQIEFPSLPDQRAIAHILGSLDDKIELNRRMNETLEQMAQAIFKSWFVDFDPVRAKAEGLDTGLPKHIADLFPDSFQDSELGEIPEGWMMEALDSIADYLNGLSLQNYPPESDEYLPVIKIAQLRKGNTEGSDRASINIIPAYIIEDGDILFSWSGSLEIVIWCGGRGALNQHLFKVTSQKYPKWFFFLWTKEHLPTFREIAAGKATTMGHIQRHHLQEAKALIPKEAVLKTMDCLLAPIIDNIIINNLQSRTLAALRDALLPKLLSGEIRVKDAEKMVEEKK